VTRTSKRFNGGLENVSENSNFLRSSDSNEKDDRNGIHYTENNGSADSGQKDDDSGETYKPSKRSNGTDMFYNGRSNKKQVSHYVSYHENR
jgi:hypothetical protein